MSEVKAEQSIAAAKTKRPWIHSALIAIGGVGVLTLTAVGIFNVKQDTQVAPEVLTAASLSSIEANDIDIVGAGTRDSVSRSQAERSADTVDILQPQSVYLDLRGDVIAEDTVATTVRELLLNHDVVLGPNDVVNVSLDTEIADGMQVAVHEGEVTHVVEEQTMGFTKQEQKDSSMAKGTSRVIQQGRDGKKQVTLRVVTAGGQEVSRSVIAEVTVQAAKPQITAIGTREYVASAPSGGGGGGGGNAGGSADGLNWPALAQCESGGRVSVVSANGLYHGLYQFSVPTWRSVGGSGLPSQASAAEQLKRAKMLYNRSGAGQWPTCGPRLFT